MAVRTRRIYGPKAVAVAQANVFTVPAGRTLIVREIRWTSTATAAVSTQLILFNAADGINAHIGRYSVPIPPAYLREDTYVVCNPGDIIAVAASAVGTALALFGVLLDGAPS